MEERKNTKYLRIVSRIGYYLKSKNIADIFKLKCILFASGGSAGIIELINNSLEHMRTLHGHTKSIVCLSAFPNKILASGSEDTNIKIWDTKGRRLISTLSKHTKNIRALCYVRKGVLVSGSDDRSLIIWIKQTESYICLPRLTGHTSLIIGIIRMSNTEIVSGEWKGALKIWDIDQGSCIRHIPSVRVDIYQMKQGIGGEVIVSHLNKVNVWGATNNWVEPLKQFNVCDGSSIELLSGDLLLRGGRNGDLEFIDYRETGCTLPMITQGLHTAYIREIKKIAKKIVVTTSNDGYLKVIDPIPRTCYMKFKKSFGWKSAIAYFY